MCDDPQNLSILIRGGRETNRDSLSSCERNGKSSARRDDEGASSVRCRVLDRSVICYARCKQFKSNLKVAHYPTEGDRPVERHRTVVADGRLHGVVLLDSAALSGR